MKLSELISIMRRVAAEAPKKDSEWTYFDLAQNLEAITKACEEVDAINKGIVLLWVIVKGRMRVCSSYEACEQFRRHHHSRTIHAIYRITYTNGFYNIESFN